MAKKSATKRERRTRRFVIRLTESEYTALEQMARHKGLKVLPTAGRRPHATKKRSGSPSVPGKVSRLLDIYTLIAQGHHPSVQFLMNLLAVSRRTAFRYLRIIDTIEHITYDPNRKGYTFVEGSRAEKLNLSYDELIVVLAAGEAVSHLGKAFGESFRTLIHSLDGTRRVDLTARPRRYQGSRMQRTGQPRSIKHNSGRRGKSGNSGHYPG